MVTRVFGWHVRHRTEQMFAPSIARRHTNRTERAELLDRSESLGADTAVRTRSHRSRQGSNLAPAKHQTRRFRGRSCDRDVAPLCRCEGMTKSGERLTGVRRSRRTNQGGEGGDTKRRRRWRVALEQPLSESQTVRCAERRRSEHGLAESDVDAQEQRPVFAGEQLCSIFSRRSLVPIRTSFASTVGCVRIRPAGLTAALVIACSIFGTQGSLGLPPIR